MDERIADGLARGRVQFRAGKRTAAVATWKEALRAAYETQNQAAAFALSKSLGDAALESSRGDAGGLQEAVGYYEYALQLLEACSLQDQYAFYPPLESVVQYIRRRRRRACRLIRELETAHDDTNVVASREELTMTAEEEQEDAAASTELCSTCEASDSVRNPIVVDEADGCFYCQSCYDAYYADANDHPESTVHDQLADVTATTEKTAYSIEDFRGFNTVSMNETTTDDPSVPVEESIEPSAEATEDIDEVPDAQSNKEMDVSTAVSDGKAEQADEDPMVTDVSRAGGDGTVDEKEIDQPAANIPSPVKHAYSIATLKALRRLDLPCPPSLKNSPVALSNAAPPSTYSRNQKSSSRKDKPAQRSAKAHSASENEASSSSATDVSASLLPSLAECEALSATMTTPSSPLELAQAFFDTPDTISAFSFATQLKIFSSTA